MNKRNSVIIAILLILASVVIRILMNNSGEVIDKDILGFFTGVLFGTGTAMLIMIFIPKKKKLD
jgi:hypothetical protein